MSETPPRARPIAPAELPGGVWRAERMVRFSDCDPAGIVYTPRFVDMLMEAVEDFFIVRLGLDYHGLIRGGLGLGWAKLDCDFLRPGVMGDAVRIAVVLDRIGGASAAFTLHIHRGEEELVRGRLVMVTTSHAERRPIPIPPAVREALAAYQDLSR